MQFLVYESGAPQWGLTLLDGGWPDRLRSILTKAVIAKSAVTDETIHEIRGKLSDHEFAGDTTLWLQRHPKHKNSTWEKHAAQVTHRARSRLYSELDHAMGVICQSKSYRDLITRNEADALLASCFRHGVLDALLGPVYFQLLVRRLWLS